MLGRSAYGSSTRRTGAFVIPVLSERRATRVQQFSGEVAPCIDAERITGQSKSESEAEKTNRYDSLKSQGPPRPGVDADQRALQVQG